MAKMGQKFKKYSHEEKLDITMRIINNKENYREISRETGIPNGTLATWVSTFRANNDIDPNTGIILELSKETKLLQQLAQMQEEIKHLKKLFAGLEETTIHKITK